MTSTPPPGWKHRSLGQLGRWTGGGTPSKANPSFWISSGIPWVSPKDMKKLLIDDAADHISEAAVNGSATNIVPEGSILVVTRSGILSHTLPLAKALIPVAINQDMKALVAEKQYDPDFLLLALRAHETSILQQCGKSGTTVANLDTDRFLSFQIPVPALQEQRRIVTKVGRLFTCSQGARADLARVPRLVHRYKQAILTAGFRGDLTKPWRYKNTSVTPDRQAIDQERQHRFFAKSRRYESPVPVSSDALPFAVPATWSWYRAESVCDFITKGTTPSSSLMTPRKGDVPYIKVYNLTFNGGLDFSRDPTYISTDTHERILPRSKVFPGDVLMNIVGPPLGKVSIVPSTSPEWNMNQAIAVFRPVPSLDRSFLAFWLLSDQLLNWAVTRSKATAGQSNLTLQICRDLPIPLCSLEEQKEIVRDIESAFERIENLAAQAVRASDLLDRLDQATLDKVFRGEILVSDKESDEA